MADRYYRDHGGYCDTEQKCTLTATYVLDLLNSIPAKDAEIERIRKLLLEVLVANNYQDDEIKRLRAASAIGDISKNKRIEVLEAELQHMKLAYDTLRAAVKPNGSGLETAVQGPGYAIFFQRASSSELPKRKAWFDNLSEAEQYVRDHQPKPVLQWVTRDKRIGASVYFWSAKPLFDTSADTYTHSDGKGCNFCIPAVSVTELLGIPSGSPGECHCYSVLDGVWTRVEEPK